VDADECDGGGEQRDHRGGRVGCDGALRRAGVGSFGHDPVRGVRRALLGGGRGDGACAGVADEQEVWGAGGTEAMAAEGKGAARFFGVPEPGSWGATPEHRVAGPSALPDAKAEEGLRELGYTLVHAVPGRGILRGQSALVRLGAGEVPASVLKADVAQCIGFDPGAGAGAGVAGRTAVYPGSLMGAIALVRQIFLDAEFHGRTGSATWHAAGLEALQAVRHGQAVFLDPGSVLMLDRARVVAEELGIHRRVLLATGQEWRRPDVAASALGPYVVPLAFPALPKFRDEADWEDVTLDALRAWDWAPENPAALRRAHPGASMAWTTHGLGDRKQFRRNLARAIERGLTEADALAGLTVVPAELCGMGDRAGTIEPGRMANLTVVEGTYFQPENRVRAVWVGGVPHALDGGIPAAGATNRQAGGAKTNAVPARVARDPQAGRGPTASPPAVLVRGATIWTSGGAGILTNAALLVVEGRIASVGRVPEGLPHGTLELAGEGWHVTPGLIDCHNHSMILGGVNEATLPSTAMVRIGDVVNSETENLHRQLAGGLTMANLLHGSANPIGGQNRVIKLRDGAAPDGLAFGKAPPGIKFALGENVKQSNWGERNTTRFPQTRMGVPTFLANRFTAARAYGEARRAAAAGKGPPVRRDLELEALGEILEGTRWIHCHAYRQDEILAFLRTMETFGVRVATLQHILEGYKVADEIARHGAGASAFADWWAFKLEVVDAIPYAGSLMRERGVLVSFNSDSSDHARRLNLEAAKAVKYGGTAEDEALRFVTLNPARQLRVDAWVGSLEPGKDGDFVIWSGHPLSTSSVCLQTWIEGRRYFDRSLEPARAKARADEREALLARARQSSGSRVEAEADGKARERFFRAAWEKARHLGVRFCQDCQLPMRREDER
jgi:imidazolonepropionase-like amidohydrolase